MENKLIYSGKLELNPSLSEEEVNFLNAWQECLNINFDKIKKLTTNSSKNKYYDAINSFIGLPLNKNQMWVLEYSFNPLIKFEKNAIIIEGESKKGQLRDALMLYQFFFFDENGFMKKCLKDLNFIKSHTFNGMIQAEKYSGKGYSQWCYIAKNSDMYSVTAKTINDYLSNPGKYPKEMKEDKSFERMNTYYPENSPLMRFININNSLEVKNIKTKKVKI